MATIYEQHDKAFERVSAYVIAQEGKKIGTIAFKFPADGAGRLYCYLHVLGTQMARGAASGGGYDKRTAAAFDAAHKIDLKTANREGDRLCAIAVRDAIKDAGYGWQHDLEAAGFAVWQAV